ncbi:Osmotic growth protein [Microsporum canis]
MAPRVIVVGGGLSGLSAAHTVYLNGGNVLLLDKQNFFGGNSTKATSGINGALTRTQVDLGIQDSVKQFYEDTLKSARDKARPDLIKVLTYKSASAVEWLQDVFNLDLTLVSRLGGHSFPRTHRGHDAKFPGMAITYALMQRLEELTEKDPERMKVLKKARVVAVNKEGNQVTGVTYEYNGETHTEDGVVVLATGGYAADFTETSLLKKWRPDTLGLSSTNGVHATGDGQKMLMAIGANGIDMDKVQVHPTGLIDPKDPSSKWKFLAAEALRGEGGILLNSDGQRFADELGHRDYVSGQMWKEKEKGKWPIRLVLNSKASNILDFHTRHYSGRGLMKKMTGAELAREIGCGEDALRKTFDEYNAIGGGKKPDPWGKKFFHNLPMQVDDTFHVALMEPVLHFTMGGIEINDKAQVLNSEKKPFDGLFACGELAGGVHGANRLGGSSLLGCVVYGRVAGDSASQYLFQKLLKDPASASGGAQQRLNQISLHIDPSQPGKVSVEWSAPSGKPSTTQSLAAPGAASTSSSSASAAPAPSASTGAGAGASASEPVAADVANFKVPEKEFTMEEVAKHNKKDDLWIVVKGVVMDVTNWLDEHPGGAQALFSHMGRDATEEFKMLHDDEVIPKYAAGVVIGRVKGQKPSLEY